MPGNIEASHLFGKRLTFNPHVHCITTYGGYNKKNKYIKLRYVHFKTLHKLWRNDLLNSLKGQISQNIINECFKKYPNGFVAEVGEDKIFRGKNLIFYIGRYLRHPAIANSRIIDYNGKGITICYETEQKKWAHQVMKIEDFIKAIIQHIPEKHFKVVRHYGIYSRNCCKKLKKILRQSSMKQKILVKKEKKYVVFCPNCGEEMILIKFIKKPP